MKVGGAPVACSSEHDYIPHLTTHHTTTFLTTPYDTALQLYQLLLIRLFLPLTRTLFCLSFWSRYSANDPFGRRPICLLSAALWFLHIFICLLSTLLHILSCTLLLYLFFCLVISVVVAYPLYLGKFELRVYAWNGGIAELAPKLALFHNLPSATFNPIDSFADDSNLYSSIRYRGPVFCLSSRFSEGLTQLHSIGISDS